jgi:hypothetical protein
MNRILSVAVVLVAAMSASAKDPLTGEPEQLFIATTAHIVSVNTQARTMMVRSSEGPPPPNVPSREPRSWQRLGIKMPEILLPGGLRIGLPGRACKSRSKSASDIATLDEYTVVTTRDTVFQDGGDPIRFEDFGSGETISIHGVLRGATLTATRVAKWD